MASMPTHGWIHAFRHLHVDRSHGAVAPHKPLLLLALIDLVEDGTIQDNRIELTPELHERFSDYWRAAHPFNFQERIWLPFFHLRYDGFWSLTPQPGKEMACQAAQSPKSLNQLNQLVASAALNPQLWIALSSLKVRQELRHALIQQYFPSADQQARLLKMITEQHEVDACAKAVLQLSANPFTLKWPESRFATLRRKVRDAAFRRVVRSLYQDTCSICGLRLLAVTGHSICEAAHVIPFEMSSNDDVRNGLGLCPVHHWCFDEGLFTVTPEYRVQVSPVLDRDRPTEDRLLDYEDAPIRLPRQVEHRPAQEALEWHRKNRLLTA